MSQQKKLQISNIYPACQQTLQAERYQQLQQGFLQQFGVAPTHFFSAPGRSEICGNHTDHNMGKVLACAVDLDAVAAVRATGDNTITVASARYGTDVISLDDLEPRAQEAGQSIALLRGICARFRQAGLTIGGFSAYTDSRVIGGSGLSSSAAYEVLLCTVLRQLFGLSSPDAVEAAIFSQYAENVYFGKPCGLMDQMACSVGGFVKIDFENEDAPRITPIAFDFEKTGYQLVITDCRADHADCTADYAQIREDMALVSRYFGKSHLRQVDTEEFYRNLGAVRQAVGDLPVLRAMHYFGENETVERAAAALAANDFDAFKEAIIASGRSSYMYLQNIYSNKNARQQALSVALCRSEQLLAGRGAWRVHGGGFGGTIQAFVPMDMVAAYTTAMEQLFGADCCYLLSVRPWGGIEVES